MSDTVGQLSKRFALSFTPTNTDLFFVLFVGLYYFLISHTGFSFSTALLFELVRYTADIVLIVYLLSIPIIITRVCIHACRNRHRSGAARYDLMALFQPYWTFDFLFRTVRRTVITLGAIYLFVHLKHLALWWHHANYDRLLWDLDRKTHFGVQPNIWAMDFLRGNQTAAVFFDWLYFAYFPYKLIVSVIFLMEPGGRKLSDQFFFACAMMWFFGGLGYIAFPADGPCYAVLSNFSIPKENQSHMFAYPVVRNIPESYVAEYENSMIGNAKTYQAQLWISRQEFLRGKNLPGVFFGIAAMPSLHVAAVCFLAFFLFQVSILAGIIGVVYAIIIFLGSIFLQWHYAIDGYAGFLLAAATTFMSWKLPDIWLLLTPDSRK